MFAFHRLLRSSTTRSAAPFTQTTFSGAQFQLQKESLRLIEECLCGDQECDDFKQLLHSGPNEVWYDTKNRHGVDPPVQLRQELKEYCLTVVGEKHADPVVDELLDLYDRFSQKSSDDGAFSIQTIVRNVIKDSEAAEIVERRFIERCFVRSANAITDPN
jgi:hypothetical protein